MKILYEIFFLTALISLVAGCNKTNEFIDDETSELKKAQVTVTVPFEADFVGTYLDGVIPCPDCGPWNIPAGEAWGLVQTEGGGNGTHLGKFTHYFEFCCNFMDGVYPGDYMKAFMVAANGDSLFVACAGQVLGGRLDHHPEDVNSYFKDPFVILGGTGRFEGAKGGGMTDDYNRDSYPENSFHHWTGTISLVKGKK
jgi:hypothetical protein